MDSLYEKTLISVVFSSLLFFGSLLTFNLLVTNKNNQLYPISLSTTFLALFLGLAIGFLGDNWYNNKILSILAVKGEFKLKDSKAILLVTVGGVCAFVAISLLLIYFRLQSLFFGGYQFSIFSFLFASSIDRMLLIDSWQRENRKTVIVDKRRYYIINNY